jgi:hypothetical protein
MVREAHTHLRRSNKLSWAVIMRILTAKRSSFAFLRAPAMLAPFAGACIHIEPSAVADRADAIAATAVTAVTAATATVPAPQAIREVNVRSEQFILIDADDRRWFRADDLDRYQCSIGVLICEAGVGRRSPRYCKCAE